MPRLPVRHTAFPQVALLLLFALFASLWSVSIATGVGWVAAAPYLVLGGVFFAAAMVLWGVERTILGLESERSAAERTGEPRDEGEE